MDVALSDGRYLSDANVDVRRHDKDNLWGVVDDHDPEWRLHVKVRGGRGEEFLYNMEGIHHHIDVTIVGRGDPFFRGRTHMNETIEVLMQHPDMLYIERHLWPRVDRQYAYSRAIGGAPFIQDSAVGEIITIGDTGLDYTHCMFASRDPADVPTLHTYSSTLNTWSPPLTPPRGGIGSACSLLQVGRYSHTFESNLGSSQRPTSWTIQVGMVHTLPV